MSRTYRIAAFAAVAIVLAAAGTVMATRAPRAVDEPAPLSQDGDEDPPPTAEELAHAQERLAAQGFTVSDELLAELASQYGLGGAIRIVAWSNGDEAAMADIRAMRDGDGSDGSGMGWGRIARELGVHPGIGSIMGGGQGREDAPGQDRDDGDDDPDD